MTDDASTFEDLREFILTELFAVNQGLDPAESAMHALREACVDGLSTWDALLERLEHVGPSSAAASRALIELRDALKQARAEGRRPGLSAWGGVVEAIARTLEREDLERNEARHTRLCQTLRQSHLLARKQRPQADPAAEAEHALDPWSWDSLTR